MTRASARLRNLSSMLLVSIGSRQQERVTNLGDAVAFAVRYSFGLSLTRSRSSSEGGTNSPLLRGCKRSSRSWRG